MGPGQGETLEVPRQPPRRAHSSHLNLQPPACYSRTSGPARTTGERTLPSVGLAKALVLESIGRRSFPLRLDFGVVLTPPKGRLEADRWLPIVRTALAAEHLLRRKPRRGARRTKSGGFAE